MTAAALNEMKRRGIRLEIMLDDGRVYKYSDAPVEFAKSV